MTNNLAIARYEFIVKVNSPIRLPDYAGSTLRGVFGRALRQLACFTKAHNCNGCLLKKQCTYIQIFEPLPQENQQLNPITPPVPYIIHAPAWGAREYAQGDLLKFGMTLVGAQAINQLPLIIMAWQRAFARGVSGSKGRGSLLTVTNVKQDQHTIIYQQGGDVQAHEQFIGIDAMQSDFEEKQNQVINIKLMTPMRLQKNGKPMPPSEVSAYAFLMGLVRRVSLLDQTHALGFNLQSQQAKALAQDAKNITIEHDLKWQDWVRYSNRQRKKMVLGGCIGNLTLKGDLTNFLPYLNIGEYLHVGKEASFGLGQYQLV